MTRHAAILAAAALDLEDAIALLVEVEEMPDAGLAELCLPSSYWWGYMDPPDRRAALEAWLQAEDAYPLAEGVR